MPDELINFCKLNINVNMTIQFIKKNLKVSYYVDYQLKLL